MAGEPRQPSGFAIAAFASAGFTLIEILVVVAIIGIATALAAANLFPSDEEKLRHESERLLAVLQLARDEASLGGRVIAVRLEGNELQFLERDMSDPGQWRASAAEGLASRTLPDGYTATLRVGGARAADTAGKPQAVVVFLPIGIAAPFELTLDGPAGRRRIAGDAIGNLAFAKQG